jgi:hypothetical protein
MQCTLTYTFIRGYGITLPSNNFDF